MKTRSGQKIKLTSVEELLGVANEESAMDIEIDRIYGFSNHPYKVLDDEKMAFLVESVKENGIITPVLVRPDDKGGYEMISGHRRMHAAKLAGLTMIPAIIREMSDDDAVIAMVDANIQREELLPSEKAWAYKMKMDAMKRSAGRPKKDSAQENNSTQIGRNLESAEIMAEEVGESKNQIRRYIRLTELIPEMLELVDKKRLQFTVAVDISYIDKQVQHWLYEYIRENGFIKPIQISTLRKYLELEHINQGRMITILNGALDTGKTPARKVTLDDKKLNTYFPPFLSAQDAENIIIRLLDQWKKEQDAKRGE